jgi:excisionase family DNA binding protein
MTEPQCVALNEAARLLRVSRWTVRRRIAEGTLTAHTSPANRRVTLLRRDEVERLLIPTIPALAAVRTHQESEGDHGN